MCTVGNITSNKFEKPSQRVTEKLWGSECISQVRFGTANFSHSGRSCMKWPAGPTRLWNVDPLH